MMDDLMSPDFFFIYHISDVILGHISISVGSYWSSWSCMITPTYGIHAETRMYSLFYHDPSVEPLLSHLVRPVFFRIRISSCFFFLKTSPWRLGLMKITEITHLMMDDFMSLDSWSTIYLMPYWGIFQFRLGVIDLHGVAWSLPLTGYTPRQGRTRYFIMISQWSLSSAIQSDPHLSAFGCHHVSLSGKRFFDPLIQFNCGYGWLGLHTWWWMIWCHLVFWPTTHLMPYWGTFPFQLRFIDFHWFAWPSPVTRCTLGWWFDFALPWFSGGAFLESFSWAHIFWCCHDSCM